MYLKYLHTEKCIICKHSIALDTHWQSVLMRGSVKVRTACIESIEARIQFTGRHEARVLLQHSSCPALAPLIGELVFFFSFLFFYYMHVLDIMVP